MQKRSNPAGSALRAPTLSSPAQDRRSSQRLTALARSTQPLYLGLLGGSANSAMPRRRQAVSNPAADSLPPPACTGPISNGAWRIRWSGKFEAQAAVAREQARMQHSLETGHTASDSSAAKPGSMATLGLGATVAECDRLGLAGPDQAGDHAPGGGLAKREAAAESAGAASSGRASPGSSRSPSGGRFGRALEAKPVAQRETVEALGGLRRKLVEDRVEAAESAVRTFGLHGAFSRLSAAGFSLSAMLPQKIFARPPPALLCKRRVQERLWQLCLILYHKCHNNLSLAEFRLVSE